MTRWAKTLGTNGWGATPSHYVSLVSTMWFDESKVWLPPGEASGRVRLWFRLHGVINIEPSIPPFWPPLTSTLRFVSPQHFDGEYRCRWEYRPRLTTFDFVVVVVFFLFLFCFIFFCTTISKSNTETILSMIKALCDTLTWVPLFVLLSTRANQIMHGEKSYKDRF